MEASRARECAGGEASAGALISATVNETFAMVQYLFEEKTTEVIGQGETAT
jgi:hypothetical protein